MMAIKIPLWGIRALSLKGFLLNSLVAQYGYCQGIYSYMIY